MTDLSGKKCTRTFEIKLEFIQLIQYNTVLVPIWHLPTGIELSVLPFGLYQLGSLRCYY